MSDKYERAEALLAEAFCCDKEELSVLEIRAVRSVLALLDRKRTGYESKMGEAGEQYHASFGHAHPLPVTWRWEDLWKVMEAARTDNR